jgi:hypothetical protein
LLLGAMICAAATGALAATGVVPQNGFGTVDGTFVNGLAAGQNQTYVYGLTATGSTQAGALQLAPANALVEVDTAASGTGVALPAAIQGTEVSIYNNGANTLTVYPAIANNSATGSQDTINNGTSFSGGVATHVSVYCFSAKTGVWACK